MTIRLPFPAIGKPTMTRADKWKGRDCVKGYFAFCDMARAFARRVPAAETIESVRIVANYRPTGSKRRAASMIGTRKRTKPDGDNIIKALSDALWKDDHKLGGVSCDRYWADRDETIIEIVLTPAPAGKDER